MESQEKRQSLREASRIVKDLLNKCSNALEIPIMEELCAGARGKPDTKLLNITSKSGNVFKLRKR